ncbi:MAG: hypothetical protein JSR72_18160 [Proteobacteria bacterium]|nr:hypothetical protein [Pseudomonadota bacterium]
MGYAGTGWLVCRWQGGAQSTIALAESTIALADKPQMMATVHPSYILRIRDDDDRHAQFRQFVAEVSQKGRVNEPLRWEPEPAAASCQ